MDGNSVNPQPMIDQIALTDPGTAQSIANDYASQGFNVTTFSNQPRNGGVHDYNTLAVNSGHPVEMQAVALKHEYVHWKNTANPPPIDPATGNPMIGDNRFYTQPSWPCIHNDMLVTSFNEYSEVLVILCPTAIDDVGSKVFDLRAVADCGEFCNLVEIVKKVITQSESACIAAGLMTSGTAVSTSLCCP